MSLMPLLTHISPRRVGPGEWAVLKYCLPGSPPHIFGVLLREVGADRLHAKFRQVSWRNLLCDEDAEVMEALPEDFCQRARETRGSEVLEWLEDTASHTVLLSPRQEITIDQVQTTLNWLYVEYVSSAEDSAGWMPGFANSVASGWRKLRATKCLFMPSKGASWAAAGFVFVLLALTTSLPIRGVRRSLAWDPRAMSATEISRSVSPELLMTDSKHLHPVLLNLDAEVETVHPRHKSHKMVHTRFRATRSFAVGRVIAKSPVMRVASVTAPAVDSAVGIPTNLFPIALPDVPKYHRRRNRLVRVLGMLSLPFRAFARTAIRD